MHRIHYKSIKIYIPKTIKLEMLDQVHSYYTRQKHQKCYFLSYVKITQAQSSIYYKRLKIWNEIPKVIKEMNFLKFKKDIKQLYLSQYTAN